MDVIIEFWVIDQFGKRRAPSTLPSIIGSHALLANRASSAREAPSSALSTLFTEFETSFIISLNYNTNQI
jgi:hypothetical protein